MPPPTSSLKPSAAKANGSSKPDAAAAAAPAKTGAAAPAAAGEAGEKRTTLSKPDKAAYDSEQEGYTKEIAEIKTKLVCPPPPSASPRHSGATC